MLKKILYILTILLMIFSIYAIFSDYSPIPVNVKNAPGDPANFKIFYFHLPIAISTYIAFGLVFLSSVLYIKNKQQIYDIIAISSSEVGVVFAFLTLVSGSIWAKSAWGAFWVTWDVRLNTSLVLFLIYLSYLMIRQAIDEPEKRARLSAVFGIVGFIGVPLSYMSIRLWNRSTMHPVAELSFSAHNPLIITLLVSIVAYIILLVALIISRIDIELIKEKISELKKLKNI